MNTYLAAAVLASSLIMSPPVVTVLTPEIIATAREQTNRERQRLTDSIAAQKKELAELKKSRVNVRLRGSGNKVVKSGRNGSGPLVFVSREARQKAISEAEAKLKTDADRLSALDEGGVFIEPLPEGPSVGDIGRLSADPIVVQVLDSKSAIISIRHYMMSARPPSRPILSGTDTFIVRGVDTSMFVDGKTVELPTPFAIRKTETYETVNGASRTVPVLEPVDEVGLANAINQAISPTPP